MKKTLKITFLVIVYLLAFSTNVQAYKAEFTGTPITVNSDQTFTLKVTVDEATTIVADSHIKYDSSLFSFDSVTQTKLTAELTNNVEGDITWNYLDTNSNSNGVKTFEFNFKAKKVTKDTTGIFNITGGTFVSKSGTYRETNVKGDKSISVTVLKTGTSSSLLSSISSKENTTTSGSATPKTSTTTYGNSISGNNTLDNTIVGTKALPKTGEDRVRNSALITGTIFIALAVIYKRKSKNLF